MKRLLATMLVALAALVAASAVRAAPPVIYLGTTAAEVSQAQLDAALPAFQTMVSRDLQRFWGVNATLTTDPAQEASASMTLYVTDSPGPLGALGQHDVIGGRPVAYIYGDQCALYADDWRLVASHELEEMLVDPWGNRFQKGAHTHRMWIVEVSDPVQSGYYAYWIDGTPISDFVTPHWYGDGKGRVDFTRGLHRGESIGVHSYASWWGNDGQWHQLFT